MIYISNGLVYYINMDKTQMEKRRVNNIVDI